MPWRTLKRCRTFVQLRGRGQIRLHARTGLQHGREQVDAQRQPGLRTPWPSRPPPPPGRRRSSRPAASPATSPIAPCGQPDAADFAIPLTGRREVPHGAPAPMSADSRPAPGRPPSRPPRPEGPICSARSKSGSVGPRRRTRRAGRRRRLGGTGQIERRQHGLGLDLARLGRAQQPLHRRRSAVRHAAALEIGLADPKLRPRGCPCAPPWPAPGTPRPASRRRRRRRPGCSSAPGTASPGDAGSTPSHAALRRPPAGLTARASRPSPPAARG